MAKRGRRDGDVPQRDEPKERIRPGRLQQWVPPDYMPVCERMAAEGRNTEDILGFIRRQGSPKVEAIFILRRIMKISMDEAKRTVHFSKTWEDVRARDEEFHEELWRLADEHDVFRTYDLTTPEEEEPEG